MSTGGKTCPATTNNLGGLGPTRGPQEIRYRAVGTVDNRKIDLVVPPITDPDTNPVLNPRPNPYPNPTPMRALALISSLPSK